MTTLEVDLDTSDLEVELDNLGDLIVDLRKTVAENTAVIRDRFPIIGQPPADTSLTPLVDAMFNRRQPKCGPGPFPVGSEVVYLSGLHPHGLRATVLDPSTDRADCKAGYIPVERHDTQKSDCFPITRTVLAEALDAFKGPDPTPFYKKARPATEGIREWNERVAKTVVEHNQSAVPADKLVLEFDYVKPAARFEPSWQGTREKVRLRPSKLEWLGASLSDHRTGLLGGVTIKQDSLGHKTEEWRSYRLDRVQGEIKVIS